VIGIGGWMLFAHSGAADRAARLLSSHGLALAGLGISISLDELAIGFSIGLIHLPATAVIVALAAQAGSRSARPAGAGGAPPVVDVGVTDIPVSVTPTSTSRLLPV
jgi:hypothetical protein